MAAAGLVGGGGTAMLSHAEGATVRSVPTLAAAAAGVGALALGAWYYALPQAGARETDTATADLAERCWEVTPAFARAVAGLSSQQAASFRTRMAQLRADRRSIREAVYRKSRVRTSDL